MSPDEAQFRDSLLESVSECRKIGYVPKRFIGMVKTQNPFDVIANLLEATDVSEGFTTLWEKKRLDLSAEAIALHPRWRGKFRPDLLVKARKRLADVEYKAPWDDGSEVGGIGPVSPPPPITPPPTAFKPKMPPIPDAEAFVARVRALGPLMERNHEDAVKDLLLMLGHAAGVVVFARGRIDVCVQNNAGAVVAVFEVKRSIANDSDRLQALRQANDYACQTGAEVFVVTDGDRYQIYDRRKGRSYDAMLCGRFQLTAFREGDENVLDLLRPGRLGE
jgi:hypothetical protein